jgi:hypothetical protein
MKRRHFLQLTGATGAVFAQSSLLPFGNKWGNKWGQ